MIGNFLHDNIRKARKRNGISQEVLAERVGLSPRQIQRIESGVSMPPIETVEKIAQSLGVSANYFFIDPNTESTEMDLKNSLSIALKAVEARDELKKRNESLEIENKALRSELLKLSGILNVVEGMSLTLDEVFPTTKEQVEAFAALKKMERPNLWKKLLYYSTTRQELLLNVLGLLTELDHARLRKEDVPLLNPLLRKGKILETSKNRTSHRKK